MPKTFKRRSLFANSNAQHRENISRPKRFSPARNMKKVHQSNDDAINGGFKIRESLDEEVKKRLNFLFYKRKSSVKDDNQPSARSD